MFGLKIKTFHFKRFFTALAALSFVFAITTCDIPMGLGDPIDWDPPVLTLDQTENPLYVRLGTRLTGTVEDNGIVERVIMRDSLTGAQMFTARLEGIYWEIELNFTREQNGEKIAAEIVAFDRFGNSGDSSIAAITLIVDIQEPVIEDIWIQRTSLRAADLEPYLDLRTLETSDPRSEKKANVERYQNGNFYIYATISEDETRIIDDDSNEEKKITLNIYEHARSDVPLYSIKRETGTSTFSPRWLIEEEKILTAGEARSSGYRTRYNNGERFYYRVEVVAYDRSENQSGGLPVTYTEDHGYFVMWKTADTPKGILDPMVAGSTAEDKVIATKGSTLPIEFFDDDSIAWAFAGLLTEDQWNKEAPVNSGVYIQGNTDMDKLDWLRTRLRAGDTIYNWKYDIYIPSTERPDDGTHTSEPINNQAPNGGLNDSILYIQTGNNDLDNGEFVLFTLIGDHKLAPHPAGEALDAHNCKAYKVSVVDENAPMIVFDLKSDTNPDGSPEENTFPDLTDGRYFTIKGYTLRAINAPVDIDIKRVTRFRVAWIPRFINGGNPDELIEAVQKQLAENTPSFTGNLTGVQMWDFTGELATDEFGPRAVGEEETIGIGLYRKQSFSKTFDILGGNLANGIRLAGSDPVITLYNPAADTDVTGANESHFVYRINNVNQLENETKLFVFFAEDNMDHKVYRQIRFLGNKAPPTINVYDVTGRTIDDLDPPDINYYIENTPGSDGVITPAVRAAYQAALSAYQSVGYDAMKLVVPGFGLGENDRTQALQAYPRGTTLKYWIMAQRIDDEYGLLIESIHMLDITNETPVEAGHYDGSANVLSYCEALPEVTQRTFLFTATDTLGNTARIQRTVTITNAAMLNEINTVSQSGTYGIGQPIILRAVFSNQVYWTSGTDDIRPRLVVSYKKNNVTEIIEIPTSTPKNTNTLFLEFPFEVTPGDSGVLKTMYNDPVLLETPANTDWSTVVSSMQNRPIMFLGSRNNHGSGEQHYNCSHIYDAERNDNAFTPGNVSGFEWSTGLGSLQASKTITLDGKAPVVTGFSLTGNTGGGTFYYKTDETISFTLTADEEIETAAVTANGTPRIRFQVRPSGGTPTGYYYANWERSVNSGRGMVFSHTVSSATPATPDGTIENVQLNYDNGRITDVNGNALAVGSNIASYLSAAPATILRIDKTAPTVPTPTLNGSDTIGEYYQNNPTLNIPIPAVSPTAAEPWGIARAEYSLNNGLSWAEFYPTPTVTAGSTLSGTTLTLNQTSTTGSPHTLRTRFIDQAGNIGVESPSRTIYVNNNFPRLNSVAALNPNGTYTSGSLMFNLVFADLVHTQGATGTPNVTITLTNRAASNTHNTGAGASPPYSYEVTLNAQQIAVGSPTNTVSFVFSVSNKEMLNGLYISAVNFSGLRDRYSNEGPASGTASYNTGINMGGYTVTNLNGSGIIVDCIAPRVTGMNPVNMVVSPGTDRTGDITSSVMGVGATTLTLTFNEPVRAGSGTITVKPHGQFFIPPVFENDNYYLNVATGVRSPNSSAGATLIKGFYEIYNSALLNATDRQTLTAEWSVISSNGDARSGQSTGPYMKMTQGLKAGLGYTGDYSAIGANGPNPQANFMIPDTSTKWVLDYRYSINNGQNTQYVPSTNGNPALANADTNVVTNIRDVLIKAKYRWQEMDVSASTTYSGNTVTITLNEPLERGLQWDICYQAGTFTDTAGNNAPAVNYTSNTIVGQGANASTHWFWSGGVQTPVIRVNRKSFDARTQDWSSNAAATRRYNVPTDRNGPGGWGIGDFNTVHYRIETETPNARIYRGTINGRELTDQIGSAYLSTSTDPTDAWSLNNTVPNGTGNWDTATQTNGTWVRPNLIRRGGAAAGSYTVVENGFTVTRSIVANTYLFRSYNRDATAANLDAVVLDTGQIESSVSSGTALNFTYYTTEARKDYVVARAAVDHTGSYPASNAATGSYISSRGYEGVFRSVVALTLNGTPYQYGEGDVITGTNAGRLLTSEGSNIKNGMPSIAGFPVRDAGEQGDNRFVKTFYRAGNDTANQFYWVSTEIVSQWYFLKWGGNGTHQNSGEANNYFTAGYGDLTFGRLVR